MRRAALKPKTLALALVALVAVAAGLVPFALNAWPRFENDTLDARFALRGAQPPPSDIVIVAIDDKTFSDLQLQWPFPRSLDAAVIDRLRADRAKAIAYDVQFTEPSANPADDLALYNAVGRAGHVVLATTEVDAAGQTDVLGGPANLRQAHAVAAAANLPADSGGVIRRYRYSTLGLTSFAVAAAETAGYRVSRSRFGHDQALIDFRGPPKTFRTVSFSDVLRGRVSPRMFAGKIVLVGATAPTLQDLHQTSTTSATPMAGVEVQANAVWTALHGNPLQPGASWLALISIVLGGVAAPLLAWIRFRLVLWAGIAAGGAAVYVVAAQLAFDHGTVLVVTYPLASWAAGVLGTLLTGYVVAFAERNAFSRRLQESQLELVQRLAQAVESRDAETGEHTYRIGMLCRQLALQIGWSATDAQILMYACIAHDIGKLGIPDSILLKPGRLDESEWETMKTHTTIGARLLGGSKNPILQMAESIALTHHEHWDGTGYPAGLKGEEIPLAGRMCAIVDVYDALLSRRVYKDAWQLDDVLAEIERAGGTQFDPELVSAFLRLAPAVRDQLYASWQRERASLSLQPAPA